jgi:hypothetical protein
MRVLAGNLVAEKSEEITAADLVRFAGRQQVTHLGRQRKSLFNGVVVKCWRKVRAPHKPICA